MIDLHTHSAVSDGTDTIPELVQAARAAGLDTLAVTDHDTMDGVELAQAEGARLGIEVLRGMEMSTHVDHDGAQRSVHLLAYGARPDDELMGIIAEVRDSRDLRVPRILEKLAGLGMPLTEDDVRAAAPQAVTIGRPHVADAMIAHGYVPNRDVAFQLWLDRGKPAYVSHSSPLLPTAIDAVNRAGGVAVIAHPWGRGSSSVVTPAIIAGLARDHGLFGIEVDHVDHSEADRQVLRDLAHDLGLVATGSSDYHGRGKTRNPLGVCQTDPAVYQAIRAQITERGGQL